MMSRRRSSNAGISTRATSNGHGSSSESMFELKEAQSSLRYDWPQLLQDDANPIELAVAFLDDTSVGLAHRLSEFEQVKQSTESALRNVVNDHHELFNNSVGSYHLLLSTLTESQQDSIAIKHMLESTTKDIHDRSDILGELSQTSARYADMIEILDAINEMMDIPTRIDQLVGDKKIHEVYDVISHGYKLAEQYNLWTLPAMNALQNYLEIQSNTLFDLIIDELQNEIYLKGSTALNDPASQLYSWDTLLRSNNPQLASFKTLIAELYNLEQYIYNSANLDIPEVVEVLHKPVQTFVNSQLPKLHSHFSNPLEKLYSLSDNDKHDASSALDYSVLLESTSSFSSESFHYIYMLLHTASKLSRLNQVIEILSGNNQLELHGLINRTIEEVKQKNGATIGKLDKHQAFDRSFTFDFIGTKNFSDNSVLILKDLFGSIFVKSLAVLQRHKIVSEIVHRIESGQNLSYDVHDIWNSIKKELQSLMTNYIYDSMIINGTSDMISTNSKIHDILRKRDLFQFEDVSYNKTSKGPEDLQIILQDMFPGFLLSDSLKTKGADAVDSNSPYIKNERFNAMVEVLVPKNLFNMRIILEFFLIFVAGSQKLFAGDGANKPANRTAIQFFEDFMKLSFLAHVRDSLDASFKEFIGHTGDSTKGIGSGLKLDLISMDKSQSNGEIGITPNSTNFTVIYQNALDFKRLFYNVCSVFNTSLTYRDEFSVLVLRFLKQFSDSYLSFYNELLSGGEENSRIVDYNSPASNKPILRTSKWIRVPSLTEISGMIISSQTSGDELKLLVQKELEMLVFGGREDSVFDTNKDDLLDNESFNQVCYLLLTTSWILTWLPFIKKESNYTATSGDLAFSLSAIDKLRYDWSFLENGRSLINVTTGGEDINQDNLYLALTKEKLNEFNAVVLNFHTIRDNTLLALRYDLRCKAIYYIGKSFKLIDWTPISEPGDSDQFIGLFNKEVFSIDNKLTKYLSDGEKESIFVGLPEFLNVLVIQGSQLIRKVNANGIKRVLLNIFTLQQMLRNLLKNPEEVDFGRSSIYFELFTLNEFNFINFVKANDHQFSADEYKNMVRLIYSEKLADGNGTQFNKTKYNDLLKKVDQVFASMD
ncbi:uncharacterized protein CANTADRAFT_44434 [Suhomyces tanzawaensis NRRL Y-17324]|uniref:Exocyst complex component Sec8 n=1 Tax=Suhomyces tanzawaensis NRRL Y-17324 TaxID=984487 RepID=A0A1E4SQX8_9ASCO|nr:uncharacterized protein CANTADRAFT_44434 [Suhomyces tanzawaensis NRRL Y-17324]ODV81812.1 hypothetical protein CANTADRAFT_44434 [Suhomyces tanzawaensis NRRL Y-17324]